MTTLIGTPPNILAATPLLAAGLEPFSFFSFTPVGLVLLLAGITFMVFIGRRLLPDRKPHGGAGGSKERRAKRARLVRAGGSPGLDCRIPHGSPLAGKTLAESRIGRALGLTILGVERAARQIAERERGDLSLSGGRLPAGAGPVWIAWRN